MIPEVALTIAGSDSGGGAGIQADLKAFAAHGIHGTSAVTAITAQNTVGVQGVHMVPVEMVDAQITSVVSDFDLAAAKTGMLATTEIIDLVADRAERGELPNLVVDPVMAAASGDRLLDEAAERRYVDRLFKWTTVITPNLFEASMLTGRDLRTPEDMADAARQLTETGARCVVVKGGHLFEDDAVDVMVEGDEMTQLRRPRVDSPNVHGTGCTFASTVAAWLARGSTPSEAVKRAKDYVDGAIRSAARWRLGSGHGPVDHFGWDSQ